MSVNKDDLIALGCDWDGVMDRFLNDDEFYFECYEQVLNDTSFGQLREELKKHNISQAFEYAHTLKGLISNIGLTQLYDSIVGIVEPLRAGSDDGLLEKYDLLMQEREKYLELCS